MGDNNLPAPPAPNHETEIQTLLANSQSLHIPERHPANLACCCGRPECAYLQHNNSALDSLERNVETAAKLGQALLVRHETYMVEAEKTRESMSCRIHELETNKKDLETENTRTIEENRGLLNQLEDLNNTIANSESHVKSLEATLQSTQQELRRLEGLASRTHELEMQLAVLEQEQLALQQTVTRTEADERSALQRWKKAERNLVEVQDQLERIEREAREERERHVEVVGRMERQREVEKELNTAAGRLKGAAAATSLQGKPGSNVVSHFVKDILQDNANLQLGIVELREMLENSNNEVQTLREQLMIHQPIEHENDDRSGTPTLRAELAPKEPQVVSQELHIHHHYHAPAKKETPRLKKKRHAINPALFTPPNGRMRPTPASTAAAILSQTSITIPSPTTQDHRWSMQSGQTGLSDFAPSSAPSSPRSNYRSSALFDRTYIDQAMDSSRPTSPGSSIDPMSPTFPAYHRKRDSNFSFKQPPGFNLNNVIHEEGEDADVEDLPSLHSITPEESVPSREEDDSGQDFDELVSPPTEPDFFNPNAFQPSLRRSTSHESILSISGLDIHTLKSRPSQLTVTNSNLLLNPRSRPSMSSLATSYVSTQPIISSSMTIARPTLSRKGHDSSAYLRSSMGMLDHPGRAPSIDSNSSSEQSTSNSARKTGIGGWVWNRWGATPTPSSPASSQVTPRPINAPVRPAHRAVTTGTVPTTKDIDPLTAFMGGRPPGINQKGPIPGFFKSEKAPSKIIPDRVDTDALAEGLLE